jgi:hypothetical protein
VNTSIIIDKICAMFPECNSSGIATNKQIIAAAQSLGITKYPVALINPSNKVAHGKYALSLSVVQIKKPEPKVEPQPIVSEPSANTELDINTLVPKVDPNYVSFGHFRDVETIIKSKIFFPIYITGPSGNGKSTTVEQVCAKLKRPMIRINLNSLSDEDQLIGTKTLVDGNIKIIDGPVVIAMRLGIPILLDEIDAGGPNALMCLQSILEGKPYFFKLKNELITPAHGFNIIATANTKGKGSEDGRYIGTNILNEAFLERFSITIEQDYPTEANEKKIIMNLMKSLDCVDEDYATSLVKWASGIRKTFNDGGVDELISTRRLTHIVRSFAIFKNDKKAVQLCINRFDNLTKDAFMKLFEKIHITETPQTEVSEEQNAQQEVVNPVV